MKGMRNFCLRDWARRNVQGNYVAGSMYDHVWRGNYFSPHIIDTGSQIATIFWFGKDILLLRSACHLWTRCRIRRARPSHITKSQSGISVGHLTIFGAVFVTKMSHWVVMSTWPHDHDLLMPGPCLLFSLRQLAFCSPWQVRVIYSVSIQATLTIKTNQ